MSVLSKYLAAPEGLNPSIDVVLKICDATDVQLDWLVRGKGDSPSKEDGVVKVPIYDVKLAAGAGSFVDRERRLGDMPIDKALLATLGLRNADGLGILTAQGDSMVPLISDKARVLVNFNDRRLAEGVFAFRVGDELRVKRLRPVGLGGVEAISENPIYPPDRLSGDVMEHFEIVGRAIWAGTIL